MTLHVWDPLVRPTVRSGQGENQQHLRALYDLERASVVLSIDSDFLAIRDELPTVARGFMQRRTGWRPQGLQAATFENSNSEPRFATMNRLYALATTPSLTTAKADHALHLPPTALVGVVVEIARRLGVALPASHDQFDGASPPVASKELGAWIDDVVSDLQAANGGSESAVVLVGPHQPAVLQQLTAAINAQLGAVGNAVNYVEVRDLRSTLADETTNDSPRLEAGMASLLQLTKALRANEVETLLILGPNPVYDAPADLKFLEELSKAAESFCLASYRHETARCCRWHVPQSHALEGWGDTRVMTERQVSFNPLLRRSSRVSRSSKFWD